MSVSAVKIHQCTLKDHSQTWSNVTVFPFFKNTGEVVRHMLVIPEGQQALWIDDIHLLKAGVLGGVVLNGLVSTLPSVGAHNMGAMEEQWHYDPWWLLKEPGYASRSWVPAAKASNCADKFAYLYYPGNLKKVTYIIPPGGSEETPQKYLPDMLPEVRERIEVTRDGKENGGWKLKESWPDKGSWKPF